MTRYLSGLCVAVLGLCGGGWLVVAGLAFAGGLLAAAGFAGLFGVTIGGWSTCMLMRDLPLRWPVRPTGRIPALDLRRLRRASALSGAR